MNHFIIQIPEGKLHSWKILEWLDRPTPCPTLPSEARTHLEVSAPSPWGTHLPASPPFCPCSLVHLLGTAHLTGPSQEAALSLRLPTCNMRDTPTNTPAESGRGMGYTNHQMLLRLLVVNYAVSSHSPRARCLWTPPHPQPGVFRSIVPHLYHLCPGEASSQSRAALSSHPPRRRTDPLPSTNSVCEKNAFKWVFQDETPSLPPYHVAFVKYLENKTTNNF